MTCKLHVQKQRRWADGMADWSEGHSSIWALLCPSTLQCSVISFSSSTLLFGFLLRTKHKVEYFSLFLHIRKDYLYFKGEVLIFLPTECQRYSHPTKKNGWKAKNVWVFLWYENICTVLIKIQSFSLQDSTPVVNPICTLWDISSDIPLAFVIKIGSSTELH